MGRLEKNTSLVLPSGTTVTLVPSSCQRWGALSFGDDPPPGCSLAEVPTGCTGCGGLTVRQDRTSGFYWVCYDDKPQLAFKEGDTALRREVRLRELSGVLAPPLAWTVGGLLGWGLGIASAMRAHSLRKRAGRLGAQAAETYRGGTGAGVTVIDDEEIRAREELRGTTAGIVALSMASALLCGAPLLVGSFLGAW